MLATLLGVVQLLLIACFGRKHKHPDKLNGFDHASPDSTSNADRDKLLGHAHAHAGDLEDGRRPGAGRIPVNGSR